MLAAIMAGGGAAPLPLRAVSATNFGPQQLQTHTIPSGATTVEVYIRQLHVIGADTTSLVLGFVQWALAPTAGVTKPGNSYDILQCAIEFGGTTQPVTFSGLRTATVADGTNLLSDELLASAFSQTKFSQGQTCFVRVRYQITSAATNKMPDTGIVKGTGSVFLKVDPTKVNMTTGIDATGAFAYSLINGGVNGTDTGTPFHGSSPILLGRHSQSAIGFWGDSKTQGTGDTPVGATAAFGMNRTLFPSATSTTGVKPGINFGNPSGVAADCTTAVGGASLSALTYWYQYLTHAVVGYGTNALTQSAQTSLHTQIRAASIPKIIQMSLTPRTSSTDAWATTANQTVSASWGVGSAAATFETFLVNKTGTDADMTYYQSLGQRAGTSGTNYWLWAVNGTGNYMTADGLHESAVGYEQNVGTSGNVTTQAGGTVSNTLRALVQAL